MKEKRIFVERKTYQTFKKNDILEKENLRYL